MRVACKCRSHPTQPGFSETVVLRIENACIPRRAHKCSLPANFDTNQANQCVPRLWNFSLKFGCFLVTRSTKDLNYPKGNSVEATLARPNSSIEFAHRASASDEDYNIGEGKCVEGVPMASTSLHRLAQRLLPSYTRSDRKSEDYRAGAHLQCLRKRPAGLGGQQTIRYADRAPDRLGTIRGVTMEEQRRPRRPDHGGRLPAPSAPGLAHRRRPTRPLATT
jgi:hypothetical protein